jgi:membrane fusion protein (multidrug efflux system)
MLFKEKIAGFVENIGMMMPESFKKKRKLVKAIGVIIGCLLLALCVKAIFFGGKKAKATNSDLVQVKVQRTKKENYTDNFSVMGTIKGTVENELRFEIDGVIASYNFREGARIDKGRIICSLDPKDSLTKTDYARSKYKSEQSLYFSASQRMKVYDELFRMKAIAESKLQEARFDTQSAEARMKAALSEVELSQSNLAKTNLIAPSNGMLAEILIKAGDYITPQDVVVKYITGGDTNFEVDVPEKDVNKLKLAMKVKINCDSYQDKDFWGTIREIAPTVKERTRTTTVKIGIPNAEGLLRSGMFGRGYVFLTELENVILVPADSVIMVGESTSLVPVVKPDPLIPGEGMVEMRHVTMGMKLTQFSVISDGLFPDELVITETQGQLSDGIHVKFTEVPSARDENRQATAQSTPTNNGKQAANQLPKNSKGGGQ